MRCTFRSLTRRELLAASAGAIGSIGSAAAFDPFRFWPIAGSGIVVRHMLRPGAITALRLSTGAQVVIRQGSENRVDLEADDNVMSLVGTDEENDTLVVEDRRRFASTVARLTVTLRALDRLAAGGATSVRCERLALPGLSIRLSGSAALRFDSLLADRLELDAGGAASMKAAGAVGTLVLRLGGSATVAARELAAGSVVVRGGGAAQAVVSATSALDASLSGAAGLGYYGRPAITRSIGGAASMAPLG